MRTNYVLIDFENVQPESFEQITHDHFKVIVFVGASQTKLPLDFAVSMQSLGSRAEYVKISSNGSNTLDFHIAYYIGRLAVEEPSACFHIISKDTGFDPLIQHLKSKKIFAGRVTTIAEIPAVKASNAKSPPERIAVILARLQQIKVPKPQTVKALIGTIDSWFQHQLSAEEVAKLVQNLASAGYLDITGPKVVYSMPSDGEQSNATAARNGSAQHGSTNGSARLNCAN